MSATFAWYVADSLNFSCEQHKVPVTDIHEPHGKQQEQREQIVLTWYSALSLVSRQCLLADSAPAGQAYLQREIVNLAGTAPASHAAVVSGAQGQLQPFGLSATMVLELLCLLTHKTAGKQYFTNWWPGVCQGTANLTELSSEAASYWPPGMMHGAKDLPDTSLSLWSSLLTLKLISLTLAQPQVIVSEAVAAALWQTLHITLRRYCLSLAQMKSDSLATLESAQGPEAQASQLAVAITRLVLPLIRSNLKQEVDYTGNYCYTLACLFQPGWEKPVEAMRAELMKSGVTASGVPHDMQLLQDRQLSTIKMPMLKSA